MGGLSLCTAAAGLIATVMPRQFLIDPSQISGNTATLDPEEAVHIRKVLRLTVGDPISLFDGCGTIWQARIDTLGKNTATALITDRQSIRRNGPSLDIGLALLKGKKMELVAQKATELGIAALHPFTSAHSDLDEASDSRISRWHRAIIEAGKQCGNPLLPSIEPIVDFPTLLQTAASYDSLILFSETATAPLALERTELDSRARILAMIGPEGGFSPEEVELAQAHGFTTTQLGSLILRAETAAISGMAILQFLIGNLGSTALFTK